MLERRLDIYFIGKAYSGPGEVSLSFIAVYGIPNRCLRS